MNIVHLTASTFHGGPERQMLGLAKAISDQVQTVFVSFSEGRRCQAFLGTVKKHGFDTIALQNDTPRLRSSIREIADVLKQVDAQVLLCHGYKADILGRPAARRCGIPVVAVSRGWTGENLKVRLYERLDRWHLRYMDHVVAVSEAQAEKVRRAGVRPDRLSVIPNAIDPDRFADCDHRCRLKLEKFFRTPKSRIIGAAGRLSPEKGFDVLISAAARVLEFEPDLGFVIFGDGACKQALQQQITLSGLSGSVFLAGFRNDLDSFLGQFDLFVLPSYTEGMPNVVLESCAAGVPVVATAVGGTPEIIEDDVSGLLAPPGDPDALAARILDALESEEKLRELGYQGRQRVLECFSFNAQRERYFDLFDQLCPGSPRRAALAEALRPFEDDVVSAEPTCEQ